MNSVIDRKVMRQKVLFPLDVLTKHAIITGGTGKGKTYFAMQLALETSANRIDCVIIDPHKHWKFFPRRDRVKIRYVEDSQEVVNILQSIYEEAQKAGPQQGAPKLRKLVIIDELSAKRILEGHRKIIPILDSCFSELRKFGYGFVIICQYQSTDRGLTPTVRENAETNFIFRKKNINDIERIRTMKHVNINMIPFLETGYFLLSSEDFYSEPFFVKAPQIQHLLRNIHEKKTDDIGESNGADAQTDADFEDTLNEVSGSVGELKTFIDNLKVEENTIALADTVSPHGSGRVECVSCGYAWTPRKAVEQIKRCPSCGTWKWNRNDNA